jgi:hypothetical protein
MSVDNSILAVNTAGLGHSNSIPLPVRLFRACNGTAPVQDEPYAPAFDTHDGKRFLVNCLAEPVGKFTVLMNWVFPQ